MGFKEGGPSSQSPLWGPSVSSCSPGIPLEGGPVQLHPGRGQGYQDTVRHRRRTHTCRVVVQEASRGLISLLFRLYGGKLGMRSSMLL